ncbi:MAG TPA: hypothetical protein VFD58_28040 [Blastocatellia bacterium]|nr:hypothetical protein [Blastocatellia bacterium]
MLSVAIALMVILVSPGFASSGPSQAEIEKQLKAHFTDTQYATRQYKLTVDSVQRGAARAGNHWADGTPANKKTTVFPCKVTWTRVTSYSTDNSVVKERFVGEYVFFRDEFGEWAMIIKKQTSEKI